MSELEATLFDVSRKEYIIDSQTFESYNDFYRYVVNSLSKKPRFVVSDGEVYVKPWGGLTYAGKVLIEADGLTVIREQLRRLVIVKADGFDVLAGLYYGGPHCGALIAGYPAVKATAAAELRDALKEAKADSIDEIHLDTIRDAANWVRGLPDPRR